MAEIKDQIGRIGNFQDAAIEKLSSMLNSAVGKAVKYASEQAKSSGSEKDYEKLSKALEDLGDDIKESLKATEKFVNEVKEAAKSFEKAKQSRQSGGAESKGSFEGIQREQTKILGMILENQKKAQSAKIAKYTTGGSSIGSKSKLSLGDMGFKPKGTDKIPAMLSPGEFVVNRRGASRNSSVLDKMNRGYRLGGLVKPKYYQHGTSSIDVSANTPAHTGKGGVGGSVEVAVERITLGAGAAAEAEKVGNQLTKHISKGLKEGGNKEIASWTTGISTALMGGGADFLQGLFSGSVTDATVFQREMRVIAFQTQGITGDFRGMQSEFSDLGQVAKETGKSINVMQKVYMSNLKKGFKNNKEGKKVMKEGLFLSSMIGSEAQQTADLFGDWHRTLALSSGEMGELARGMRNVALTTGVTGDELLGAMKSSEGILKNLRNQGNLTADVAKTVIGMMAEAKKTGFEEITNKVLNPLSSTGSILDADSKTQALIFGITNRMGGDATNDALSGTFMEDRQNLAGFSTELMSLVGDLSDGAIKSLGDFDKLSKEQKKELTLRLRGYGLTIAEAESLIKTTELASKGLAGNVEALHKIGSNKFSTEAEKKLAGKQESGLYLGSSLDYLTALGEDAKDKGLSGALKDSGTSDGFKNKRQDFTAMAGALTAEMKSAYGIGGTSEQMSQQLAALDPTKAAELNALIFGEHLKKEAAEQGMTLEKDFGSEIKAALAKGDAGTAELRALTEEASTKQKEISVGKKAAVTPEEGLAQSMNELNETIRKYTSSFVRGIVDYIGSMGLLLIQLGLLATGLSLTLGKGLFELTGVMGGLFPKGGIKGLIGRMSGFDDLASKIAKSDNVGEGMFKEFFKTFRNSRKDGIGFVPKKGKGVFGSLLDATDELGHTLKDGLIQGIEDVGKKGGKMFNRLGTRINLFGEKVKGSFSSALGAFKNARKQPSKVSRMMDMAEFRKFRKQGMSPLNAKKAVEKMGGFSRRGMFSSLKDAGDEFIKGMTGKVGKLSGVIDSVSNSKVVKMARGSFDSLFKSFEKGKRAFRFMRSGNKNPFSSFAVGFDQFSKNLTGGIKPFEKISSIFSSFIGKVKNFKLSNLKSIPGILKGGAIGMFKGVKNVMSGGIGGLVKGFGPLFRGGMKGIATGLRGALAGGTLGMSQLIFGAIDMVFGAVTGFQNTGKNFEGVMKAMGKTTKDMTWGMYASSTIAGGLVGILDGLTFGMLRLTGVADFLEQTLSLVFYAFFSIIEGFISGVMVAIDMVKPALKSLYDSLAGLGKALLGLFNSVASIFGGGEAKSAGEAFAMLYSVLKPIGQAIGMIVGVPLGAILWTLVKVIGVGVNAITLLVNIFTVLVKTIIAPFKSMFNIVAGLVSSIVGVFKWMFDILVGKSIIPDLCIAIVGIFGRMALNVIKGLGSFVFKVAKFFLKLPFKIMGGLYKIAKFFLKLPFKIMGGLIKTFVKLPLKIFGKTMNLLSGGLFNKGLSMMSRMVGDFFTSFKGYLVDFSMRAFKQFYKFLNFLSGGWLDKAIKGIASLGSKIVTLVDDYLIKPLTGAFQKIASLADDFLIKPLTGLMQKVTSLIPKWLGGGANGAGAAAKGAASLADDAAKGAGAVAKGAAGLADDAAKGVGAAAKGAAGLADDAAKAVVSSADDILKAAPKALGFLGKASGFVGMAAKKLPIIGPLLDFGIRKAIGQDTAEAAVGTAGGLGGGLAGAAIGTMILPGIGTAIGGLIGSLAGSYFADTAYDAVAGKKSPTDSAAKNASASMEKTSVAVATPVGQHAVPIAKPSESADVGSVQPVHMKDITGSILRDKAGISGRGKIQSDELSKIEEASLRQVDELEQIKEGISEMVALLKPKGNGVVGGTGDMGPGRTKDPRRPLHSAQFGKMKYGKAGGNANRSLVNNGEV